MIEIVGRKIEVHTLKGVTEESIDKIGNNGKPSVLDNVFIIANNKCIYAERMDIYFYPQLIDELEDYWIRFYPFSDPITEDTKSKLIARVL